MSIAGASSMGNDFDILAYAASGMEAQRGALEVGARNIALAQTATPDHPVKAYAPVYAADTSAAENPFASLVHAASGSDDDDMDSDSDDDGGDGDSDSAAWSTAGGTGTAGLVAMVGVKKTDTDVNPITQMLDMVNAQRAYESNASVFDLGKTIASKTIDLENTQ